MGEAETRVQFTTVRARNQEAAERRNKRRRSKTAVRNDEETLGGAQKTAVVRVTNTHSERINRISVSVQREFPCSA